MLTRTFKNKIRDYIWLSVNYGMLGTGTTTPTEDDTNLETPISASQEEVTKTTFDKGVKINYVLPSDEGNGNTYSEFGLFWYDNTLVSRQTFEGVMKDSDIELTIIKVINIE